MGGTVRHADETRARSAPRRGEGTKRREREFAAAWRRRELLGKDGREIHVPVVDDEVTFC